MSAVVPLSLFAQEPAEGQKAVRHERDDPRARAEYLHKLRSGGRPIPRGARLRALNDQKQMMVNEGKRFWERTSAGSAAETTTATSGPAPGAGIAGHARTAAAPSANPSTWVNIGPTPTTDTGGVVPVSGRVTSIAIDPSDSTGNTVYIGGAQGGVWKTINGGTTWSALTDNQPSLAIGSIVLDPQNSQIVYVGTGEENFGLDNYYGIGILKSTDGGQTWANVANSSAFSGIQEPECDAVVSGTPQGIGDGCGGIRIGSLAAANQSGTTVLLAAVEGGFNNTGGLYRSTTGGGSWTVVGGTIPGSPRYTADQVVFATPTTAYAGIDAAGVFKSTDGGATFTSANTTGLPASTGRVSVAASNDGVTVYAAMATSVGAFAGLFRSTNAAVSWTRITDPSFVDFCGTGSNGTSNQCFYDMLVAVSPTNPFLVLVGGAGFPLNVYIEHSTDGGTTWFNDSSIHADQHAGAFTPDGNTFYIGNDGGAYKVTGGITSLPINWIDLNATLGLTQFYSNFAIDPTNPLNTFGGSQDNGTQQYTGDLIWNNVTCGDGAGAVIDSNSGRVFTNCDLIDMRESDDGSPGGFSSTQNSAGRGLVTTDTSAFIPPLVGDHGNPLNLYFGTNKIYRATSVPTASVTWSVISGATALTNGGAITNMDVSNDNTTIYVVSDDGRVSKGVNLLTTPNFSNVTGSGFPAGNYITSVRISPFDNTNNTVYITLAGFAVAGSLSPFQHIYKTISGGGSWTNISNNLPNTPVNDLVVDPDLPNTLYAATDVGVFISTNDGASWSPLQSMLPRIAVLGLRLHRGSRILRAATHGRGMWDLYVPSCNSTAGACLTLSAPGLLFGNLAVGTTSAPQTLTVTNKTSTSANLTINGIQLTGSDYAYTSNCSTVAPNGTCSINVTFTPRGGLARNGTLTIFSSGGPAATVSLNGTGLVVPTSDNVNTPITITALPFTATVITNGATSSASDPLPSSACVTTYNPPDPLGYATSASFNHHSIWFNYTPQVSGNVDLDTLQSKGIDTVLSVWIGPTNALTPYQCNDDAAGVKQSQLLGMAVNAGITYHIMVTGYYANDFGAVTFHMAQNGSVATSAPFILSASVLNFTALLGRPSGGQTVTITNNSGSLQNINLSVGGEYSFTTTCLATLASGASCNATIVLKPSVVGEDNSALTITDGAGGSPQVVSLTGFAFNFNLANPRPHRPARGGGVVQGMRQQFQVALNVSTGGATLPVSLSCAGAPVGSTCSVSPTQINAPDGATPIIVTLQTSAGSPARTSGLRTRRLSNNPGTPLGDYNLSVTARVGDAESTTIVPVTVIAAPRAMRLSR